MPPTETDRLRPEVLGAPGATYWLPGRAGVENESRLGELG